MGKRGPHKRTPLQKLQAEAQRSGALAPAMALAKGTPDCPEHLSQAAKRVWNRVVPELGKSGILALVDVDALAIYCQAVADTEELTQLIAREGLMVTVELTDRNGRKTGVKVSRPHPATALKKDAERRAQALAEKFGLTPQSRSNIAVPLESYGGSIPGRLAIKDRAAATLRGETLQPSGNSVVDLAVKIQVHRARGDGFRGPLTDEERAAGLPPKT